MKASIISRSFGDIFILESPMLGTSNTNATRAFHTKCIIWTDFNKNEMTYYVVYTFEKIHWKTQMWASEMDKILTLIHLKHTGELIREKLSGWYLVSMIFFYVIQMKSKCGGRGVSWVGKCNRTEK